MATDTLREEAAHQVMAECNAEATLLKTSCHRHGISDTSILVNSTVPTGHYYDRQTGQTGHQSSAR